MSEKFNVQVNMILATLQLKLETAFSATGLTQKTVLGVAKELGYLQGRQGRNGGTFATETGMAFANLSGEIIKPLSKAKKTEVVSEACACPAELVPALAETPTVLASSEVP